MSRLLFVAVATFSLVSLAAEQKSQVNLRELEKKIKKGEREIEDIKRRQQALSASDEIEIMVVRIYKEKSNFAKACQELEAEYKDFEDRMDYHLDSECGRFIRSYYIAESDRFYLDEDAPGFYSYEGEENLKKQKRLRWNKSKNKVLLKKLSKNNHLNKNETTVIEEYFHAKIDKPENMFSRIVNIVQEEKDLREAINSLPERVRISEVQIETLDTAIKGQAEILKASLEEYNFARKEIQNTKAQLVHLRIQQLDSAALHLS